LFVFSLCLLGVVLYYFKDHRTPSIKRIEQVSDIRLPEKIQVLRDEYQDMWRDYNIVYDVQLNNQDVKHLVESITSSKYFSNDFIQKANMPEDEIISDDIVNAVWFRSPQGYDFTRTDGQTVYRIEFDTLTKVLKYREYSF
jgi:hypothetical protein